MDLDETLLVGDAFRIGCRRLWSRDPVGVLLATALIVRGRARVKQFVASRCPLDPQDLEFHPQLVERLGEESTRGREIVLVTGADQRVAHAVAGLLGCFADVLASDGRMNLTGPRKARVLIDKYGPRGFDYVGNSRADLAVWKWAREAWIVSNETSLVRETRGVTIVGTVLSPVARGLRIHRT